MQLVGLIMRWEDENYVRLYTRDTTDWKLLSWEARALFVLLMRKLDRAGILELGRQSGGQAALSELPTAADCPRTTGRTPGATRRGGMQRGCLRPPRRVAGRNGS